MRSTSLASQRGANFARRYLIPFIEFICALGSNIVIFAGAQAHLRLNGALGVGVSPASNTTANLPQSTVTSFDKVFLENLKGNTPWMRATSRRTLDEHSGNKLALFMYSNLAAPPITTAPEGTIQTGLTIAVVQNSSTMGQYADYMNISDYALGTAIDPTLEALGVQMSYRLAQVINTVVQNTADAAAATDTLVDDLSKDATTTLTTTDITAAVQSLAGVNALPMENGSYFGIIHPFTVGDILTDKTNNSLVDVVKRTAEGIEQLRELPSPDGDRIPVIDWGGVTFFQSTFVKKTPNYKGGTGTALRTYIVGKDGVIGVSFGGRDHTQIGEGNYRNLQVWVRRLTEPTGYDPSRMIGGFASYNAMYTASLPPDPVQRIRYIDAVSAIA
jgi:N4-gp56 family major capsid protein